MTSVFRHLHPYPQRNQHETGDVVDTAGRLLVVDDESIVAADISATLRRFGHEVLGVCGTVRDCLARVDELRPDLVLMDINLEGQMEGVDCALMIREQFDVPCIFLTAYADDATMRRAKLARPVGYLVKPFKPTDLRVALEMALYRARLERQVEQQQAFLAAIFDGAGVGIAAIEDDERVVEVNAMLLQMLGIPSDETHQLTLDRLLGIEHAARERQMFRQLLQGERTQYQLEIRYMRANGEIGLGYVTATRIPRGDGRRRVVRVLSDISYTKLHKVAEFQENERHLISSEIHDAVSQPLAGVFYRLQATAQLISLDVGRAREALESSLEVVQQLLEELSRLIYNLRTPSLTAENIIEAIERLAVEFRRESSASLQLRLPSQLPFIGRLHALFLYRIIQESLTNVRRHAHAHTAVLQLELEDGRVKGRVEDDGIPPTDSYEHTGEHRRKHFGIRAMRERAELLGGQLTVRPGETHGTVVAFELPLAEDGHLE